MKFGNPAAWLLWMLFGLSFSPSARAQERKEGDSEPREEHFHRNELALVLASTYAEEAEEWKNDFTIGGEYERRFSRRLGWSATFERTSEAGGWVFIFPATFRVYRELKLLAGPGFARESPRPQGEGGEEVQAESEAENQFLFRIGAQYGFEIGERCSIVPGIEFDWIDEQDGVATAVVYGVNFGIRF